MSVRLQIRGLSVRYASPSGPLLALDRVSLDVPAGAFAAVIGPSGCGKTTLLHTLIGEVTPCAGTIDMAGCRAAMVFQRPTLLPWKTVLDNALFGIACTRRPTEQDRHDAAALLRDMGLGDHLSSPPHTLSEGMKQRVNLARALLTAPDVLLLDEPFAALDAMTRRRLQDDLLKRIQDGGLTALLVSHSLSEVTRLCDQVTVLTARPGQTHATLSIDLPHPRGRVPQAEQAERLAALLEAASRA